jgi:DNA primase
MVEGYTDVISMHQCGVENVVANSGTALNEAQIRLLHRFTSNITLLYDGDSAGIHAALRGTDMLLAEGMNVKILLLPDGDDPDSFARKHNATEFRQYVEANQTDFIIFKTNLLLGDAGRDPLKRAQLIKDIVKSISVIPEEIIRSTYLHECSELLGADEAMLIRETNKNRKAELERIQKEKERERERQKLKENNPQQRESDFAHTNDGLVPPPPPAPEDVPPYDPDSIPPADTDIPLPIDAGEIPPPQEPIDRPPFGEESHIFATKTSKDEARFIGLERLIMTIVARHGEQPITVQDAEGNNIQISIAQYVESELTNDGLQFRSPLYALMLNETAAHSADPGFVASRYLLNNPSLEISREAANLLSEQYHLSKSEDKKDDEADDEANEAKRAEEEMQRTLITATNTISRLLLDYKYTFIENELRTVSKLLTDPSVINNPERCNEVMQQYITLSNIQRELAKHLGDRVFVK